VDNFDYKIFLNFGIMEREKKPFNTWFTIMLAAGNSDHADDQDREKFGTMTREQRKERNLALITGPEPVEAKIQESSCPHGTCSHIGGSRRRKNKKRKEKKHSNKSRRRRRRSRRR
jgi:hypothetical protein